MFKFSLWNIQVEKSAIKQNHNGIEWIGNSKSACCVSVCPYLLRNIS